MTDWGSRFQKECAVCNTRTPFNVCNFCVIKTTPTYRLTEEEINLATRENKIYYQENGIGHVDNKWLKTIRE